MGKCKRCLSFFRLPPPPPNTCDWANKWDFGGVERELPFKRVHKPGRVVKKVTSLVPPLLPSQVRKGEGEKIISLVQE